MVTEGDIKEVGTAISHKDMQWIEQQKWTRAEVASVFELSVNTLGSMEGATFSNVEWGDK